MLNNLFKFGFHFYHFFPIFFPNFLSRNNFPNLACVTCLSTNFVKLYKRPSETFSPDMQRFFSLDFTSSNSNRCYWIKFTSGKTLIKKKLICYLKLNIEQLYLVSKSYQMFSFRLSKQLSLAVKTFALPNLLTELPKFQ